MIPARTRRPRAVGMVGIAVATVVLSGGCVSSGEPPLQIGSKRVAVDLRFKDDAKADPPKPPTVVELPPLNPTDTFGMPRILPTVTRHEQPASTADCAAGPTDAPAREVAPTTFTKPPRAGSYPALLEGSFDISVGALHVPFQGKVETTVTYANVQANGTGAATTYSYDVIVKLGEASTTTSYLVRPASADVQLVRQVSVSPAGTSGFEPLQPMTWYQMKGVGTGPGDTDQWSSAGTDPARARTFTLEGSNVERERIDVCGAVHETFRVHQREHGRSLSPGSGVDTYDTTESAFPAVPGGTSGSPNIYNVATQLGGLVLRTEYHYTQTGSTTNADGSRSSVTATVNASLTLLSTSPQPTGAGDGSS